MTVKNKALNSILVFVNT